MISNSGSDSLEKSSELVSKTKMKVGGQSTRSDGCDSGSSILSPKAISGDSQRELKSMDRHERMVYLESLINTKDSVLEDLSNEIKALAGRRREMLELPEPSQNKPLLASFDSDLPDMRKWKDRWAADVDQLRLELKELKDFTATRAPKLDAAFELARLVGMIELNDHLISALYKRPNDVKALEEGTFLKNKAFALLQALDSTVTTLAAKQFANRTGYIFGDLIVPPSSQARTVLQHVIKNNRLYCAKIGDPASITCEVDAMSAVHGRFGFCPTVLKFVDKFNIKYGKVESSCLIIPFYPKSLAEVLMINFELPDDFVVRAALCGLATIKALNEIGYCHGDIKPSNMMLDNGSDVVITIDFGAFTKHGDLFSESSLHYSMGVSSSSIEYDLTCLCSSILQLKRVIITNFKTKDELLSTFSGNTSLPYVIAMLCLNHTNVDAIISRVISMEGSYSDYIEKVMPRIEMI